jgi:outer membrane protein
VNLNQSLSFEAMTPKRIFIALSLLSFINLAQAKDLMTVYELALDRDPTLKQALAQRNAVRQNRPLAISQLLPSVNASAISSSVDNIILSNTEFDVVDAGIIRSYGYSLNAQQPLIDLSKWFTLSEADFTVTSADAAYVASEQSLILRVAQSYFEVLNAEDDLTFTQAEKNSIQQQLRQTEEKFNVGLVAITDLNDFRARFDESVANELTAQNALDDAKERLKIIIGQTSTDLSPLKPELPLKPPSPSDMERWVEFAQINNPVLTASEATMNAKKNTVKVERSQHLPSVFATGSFGEGETGLWLSPEGNTDSGWSFAVNAQMNLFAGGGIEAAVRKAQYNYEDSREAYEETRRTTISNARIAYRGVLTAMGQVQAFNQAVISAQSAFDANQASFEVGVKTSIDVLDSLSRLYNQQRNLAASRYSYILEMLRLKQAAGTLNMEDVRMVNQWLAELPA